MAASSFAIPPPIEPMLAKLATELPPGGSFLYEPKWDGFRALVGFQPATCTIFRQTARDQEKRHANRSKMFLTRHLQNCGTSGKIYGQNHREGGS